MPKPIYFLYLLFVSQFLHAQIEQNTYEMNTLDNLLTDDVKKVISRNIHDKQTVFLGEAVHYSGSDFLAKAEFVKYLVLEHGYKDIAFESDFYALLFDHSKRNLFKMWSMSDQCKALMTFLKDNNVTIWGFDNQMHSYYSHKNFANKLAEFLTGKSIEVDKRFISLTDILIKNGYNSRKFLSTEEITYLKSYALQLSDNQLVKSDPLWKQIIESFYSTIEVYTIKDNNNDKKIITIRDKQMAKNLDFLVKQDRNRKMIVWLANAHMSKCDYEYMDGMTMGAQFRALNPNTSYHIAFGSIKMPPERTEKSIIRAAQNKNNILYYLPSLNNNYFLDAGKITNDFPLFKTKLFTHGWVFNIQRKRAELLNHYDALVFITGGIEVSYEGKP